MTDIRAPQTGSPASKSQATGDLPSLAASIVTQAGHRGLPGIKAAIDLIASFAPDLAAALRGHVDAMLSPVEQGRMAANVPQAEPHSHAAERQPASRDSITVRPGDTLSAIAARHGTTVAALVRANGIRNPDLIHPGQVLHLGRGGGSRIYVVRQGDTLSGIAARQGTGWVALARLNGLADPDRLAVGQQIRLPGSGGAPDRAPNAAGSAPVDAPVRPGTAAPAPADGVLGPGRASVEAARYAEERADGRPSTGYCYRWVKEALQRSGASPDYMPGQAAKNAGPALEARGFRNVLGASGNAIRSAYDAPVGAVLVYGPAPGATDKNVRWGHIEIRTERGFASDYFSTRARTGAADNGLQGRSRVLIGVYVRPDAGSQRAPALLPGVGTAPGATGGNARYTAANLDLGVNERFRADILHAARASGLPPQTVAAVISAEAATERNGQWRADSYNAASGATGLTQFVRGTWLGEARGAGSLLNTELRGRGLDPATMSDRNLLALRTDARLSIVAGVSYARSNIASLQASGAVPRDLDPAMTAKVAYIAHHEGSGGARAFFRGDIVAVDAKWAGNVPAGQRETYLARAAGDRAEAYHLWLTDYTNMRIDVTRFMNDGGGLRPPSVGTLVR